MIINIRGTNGSGKSTVVRGLMAAATACTPIAGVQGIRNPEAYRLTFPWSCRPVFVLGPYITETGGCDAVHPFDLILELLEKYAPRGHVVFEGALISDHYGRVGRWLEDQPSVLVVFLDTPLEECLHRVRSRRAGRGRGEETLYGFLDGDDLGRSRVLDETNTRRRYGAVDKVRQKMGAEGRMGVLLLSAGDVVDAIRERIVGSDAAQY